MEKLVAFNSASLSRINAEDRKKRLEFIMNYIKNHPNTSRSKLRTEVGMSDNKIKDLMAKLENSGKIKNVGTARKPDWKVL